MTSRGIQTEPTHARLRVLVLCSALLHLLLFAGWHPSPWITGGTENILSVLIEPSHSQVKSSPRISQKKSHHNNYQQVSSGLRTSNKTLSSEGGISVPAKPISEEVSGYSAAPEIATPYAQPSEQVIAQIRAKLTSDLARYFDYPYVARQRGWEGTVLLTLQVEPDGQLERIHITRSSGYAVLDMSALASLKQLDHLTEARAWLLRSSVEMQLPVSYRLVKN